MRLSLKVIIIVVGLVTLLMSTLFMGLIIRINRQNDEAMLTTARAIYRNVVITRKWVSDMDGILVKKQDGMQANPYLEHPLLVTSQGDTLLLKNPALVTRELSMLSDSMGGEFTYHLASEKFLNPLNKPDPFEEAALRYYSKRSPEQQSWEYFRMERRDSRNYFRYFAPLYTQESCLSCHEQQGYSVGDLRGGISVLVSADSYLSARRSNIFFMLGMALVAIILLSILLYASLQRSIIDPLRLMEIQASQFEDGNYTFDLVISNKDEIGKLATTFQLMGQRIQRFTDRLRNSESKYRRIIENSPEAVAIIDAQGQFIEFNDNFLHLSGYNDADLKVLDFFSLLNLNRKRIIQEMSPVPGEIPSDVERFETTLCHRNNSEIAVEVTITSGLTLEQQTDLSFVYLHNLSERKQMEKVSLQTEKMSALGRLSAGIAHEIRNPLFALNNNLGFLKEKLADNEALNSIFPELEDSTERIGKIISTVLDFARPHKSKLEQIDLNEVITHNLDLLSTHVDNSSIRTILELEPDLPPMLGDSHHLGQVVVNLVMNAVQALENRGQLKLTTRSLNKYIEFIVEDTGQGIAAKDIDHIFDPFFTKSAGGTGLGLAVTQRILEQHHAHYHISSELNMGTSFQILFPIMEQTKS